MFRSIDPYSGEEWASYQPHSDEELEQILQRSFDARTSWRKTPLAERTAFLRGLATVIIERKEKLGMMMVREMGKPYSQAVAEVEKCAWLCRHYAERAKSYLQDEGIDIEGQETFVRHDPLGVVLGIMPWNYPLWQAFRFFVPALTAGNVCLLKHASNVFASAEAMADLLYEVGYPEDVFQYLKIGGRAIGKVIEDDRVHSTTLTGSEEAGSNTAMLSGKHLKPSLLELGGNNAFIVLDDADLEKAVDAFVTGRFQNNGQSCIAAKRLLLDTSIYDEFLEQLKKRVETLVSGDPKEPDTDLGPLAREDLAIELERQLLRSVSMGANVLVGGNRTGAFFEATILTEVTPGMPAFDEETFGPLACVTRIRGLDEAIDLSNQSKFGLGVSIFTSDIEGIRQRISDFNEGAVFINDFVKSDPRVPFGGIKTSGYGRELGVDGIRSFVNRKTVVISGR